ncbi:MAG: ribokinase, partial [Cyclobacteriaceae bacterium]|nr:ribokinase [Cyclobacteriaceae bacterium]
MKKITVIGSSNTDMVIKSSKLPAPGETILGGEFLMNPGGKGANQAVAAARLGGDVTFVAKTGDDIFGIQAVKLFEKEGIQTEFIATDPNNPSGVALIMVDDHGENCISVALGSNG